MELNQSETITDSAKSIPRRDFLKAAGVFWGREWLWPPRARQIRGPMMMPLRSKGQLLVEFRAEN
jgi:hypothetical protein